MVRGSFLRCARVSEKLFTEPTTEFASVGQFLCSWASLEAADVY
jgi:hypothetical protein